MTVTEQQIKAAERKEFNSRPPVWTFTARVEVNAADLAGAVAAAIDLIDGAGFVSAMLEPTDVVKSDFGELIYDGRECVDITEEETAAAMQAHADQADPEEGQQPWPEDDPNPGRVG